MQRWARAFRSQEYHAAVNTNNGSESLNKVLKYSFLPRKKTMNMTSLITLLIESFLPEAHQKYLYRNYSQSGEYRTYKSFVPDYLKGRPHATILHCLERKAKALKYSSDDVLFVDEQLGIFEVKGSKGTTHITKFGLESEDHMPHCTCLDWKQWNLPCKHFFAIFRIHSQWNWYQLPHEYLCSPYLTIDSESLGNHFRDGCLSQQSTIHDETADSEEVVTQPSEHSDPVMCDLPKQRVCCHLFIYLYLKSLCIIM